MKGRILSLQLLFLSLVCCNLYAMDPCHQSVVYLFEHESAAKDGWGRGTGVVVKVLPGGGCYILTAAHVITENGEVGGGRLDPSCSRLFARFADGAIHEIEYVKHSRRGVDLALYKCKTYCVDPVRIADKAPADGDMLYLQGAPHRPDGTRNYEFECNPMSWCNEVFGDGECWTGESGTAILNSDGELVSILTGGWRAVRKFDGSLDRRSHPSNPFVQSQRVYPILGMSTPSVIKEFIQDDVEAAKCELVEYSGGSFGDDKKLVLFSADWCVPCKELRRRIESMLPSLAKAGISRVLYIDCDKYPELKSRYRVSMFPTVFLSEDGQSKKLFSGLKSSKEILEFLK